MGQLQISAAFKEVVQAAVRMKTRTLDNRRNDAVHTAARIQDDRGIGAGRIPAKAFVSTDKQTTPATAALNASDGVAITLQEVKVPSAPSCGI